MTLRLLRAAIVTALGATLAIYAAASGHDFYHHADRAITVTVDDGEAGIAYALASHGRYAFLASPLVGDLPRLDGQFNYGPWYFYLAAGVIWLFGFSLTAIRSIHFWVVIAAAVAAMLWFRGRDRAAAPALFGFGFLYFFTALEWPMARPDSLVTAFAIAMIVAIGAAVRTSTPVYWFAAGLASACGAFTHLIAAALVPAAVLMLAIAVTALRAASPAAWRGPALRWSLMLAAGLLVGAVMFYASFGFDLPMQIRFLRSYRDVTASSDTYVQAIGKHFAAAFGPLPPVLQALVVATPVAALLLAFVLMRRATFRAVVVAYLLPPVLTWLLYVLSNGKYTNYHTGYAILHHALFLWTAASLLWVTLSLTGQRRVLSTSAGLLAATLVLLFGIRLTATEAAGPARARAAASNVSFREYEARVLDPIPPRATAWGSVIFGVESPDRVQLVQYGDASTLAKRVDASQRQSLAPDYIVWGYPESANESIQGTRPAADFWASVRDNLPRSSFRLVSMVSGAPYGTTRVYQRTNAVERPARMPIVAVYDAAHERWLDRIGAPETLALTAVTPAPLRTGAGDRAAAFTPRSTMAATLPYGAYLLRVSVAKSDAPGVIVVMAPESMAQPISGLVPDGDLLPYGSGDRQTYGLLFHNGGPLYFSQFDSGTVESVEAYPVGDLLMDEERPSRINPLPDFTRWEVAGTVRASLAGGRFRVEGDNSAQGYQVSTPMIPFLEGDYVEVRAPSVVTSGRVCLGALNAAGYWLVSADIWREVLRFRGDTSGGFKVMFANCNRGPGAPASRFDIAPGAFIDDSVDLYADRLTQRGLGLEKPLAVIAAAADLGYHAANLAREGGAWKISGKGESKYSFLLRSLPRRLTPGDRVLITGRVTRGGVTLGLLRNGQWAGPADNIDTPGPFRRVLVPRLADTFEIAVANFLGDDLETAVVIDRIEVYPSGSVPE